MLAKTFGYILQAYQDYYDKWFEDNFEEIDYAEHLHWLLKLIA